MTPDRERLLRQFNGSYFGKDEMWAEIDSLRQQLTDKDAKSERLEAECAAIRKALKPFADAVYNDNGDVTLSPIPPTLEFLRARSVLSSTTAGTDLLARLQAAEKRAAVCEEVRKSYLDAIHQSAEQERDMRQMVEALEEYKDALYGRPTVLGLGHCINYDALHIKNWWKDPNARVEEYAQKIVDNHQAIHARLLKASQVAEVALALPSAQRLRKEK